MRRMILLLLCCLLMLGCLSTTDVGDCVYVLCFGVERGETFAYRVVLLCAMPEAGAEEGAALKTEVLHAEARTLFEAIETLNAGSPLALRFSRTALLLFSEPLAREGKIPAFLDWSLGALDIYSDVRVAVFPGSLETVLDALRSDADPSLSKTMANIERLAKNAGTVIDARCRSVREAFAEEPFDAVLPYLGPQEDEPVPDLVGGEVFPKLGGAMPQRSILDAGLIGSAIFCGTEMVGTLCGRHTQLVGLVSGDFRSGRMAFWHPQLGMLSIRLQRKKAPRVRVENGRAEVTVRLDAELEYPLSAEASALEPWLTERLQTELFETFSALQVCGSDAMRLGTHALQSDPLWDGTGWKAQYETLEATFTVKLRLLCPGGTA